MQIEENCTQWDLLKQIIEWYISHDGTQAGHLSLTSTYLHIYISTLISHIYQGLGCV